MTNATPASRRVTVAHAIHSGGFYGAEKVLCDLARAQRADSPYAPRLLALLDPGQESNAVCDRAETLGLPVDRVWSRPGIAIDGVRAYAAALTASGAGLVHSHGYKPTVFHLFSRWLGLHRVPLVVTSHGYSKDSGGFKAGLYRWMDLSLLPAAECVVAVSREMESYLRARNPLCRPRTIPNGIPARDIVARAAASAEGAPAAEAHPLRAALGIGPGVPVIGTAGRLVPMKNHALLIRAYARARRIAPCRLAILGDGPLRSELEELWRRLVPDEAPGLIPFQDDVQAWMADMDIFAMPSRDGEGLPMALLEAGLLGKAAVVTDSGGMPEVVEDWISGRVVARDDEDGLVRALTDTLIDPERRAAYGQALRRAVMERHDIGAVHARYLEAYAGALAA